MLSAICSVAPRWPSIVLATASEISCISLIVALMPPIAPTTWLVAFWIALIRSAISPADLAVCPARPFTSLVTILPNDQHDTNKMKIATGAWWTFLSDADLHVQRALEIDEYTDPHHAATVPHTIILVPGLVIDKVYCGYWFWGRPSPYQLWQDLADLFRRIKPDFDPLTDAARAEWEQSQGAMAGVH